ncbi:hypothetical protein EON67_08355 [archaeon]|nr:MAG: hypothetical protein EON67_08355 [archaeon]
MCKRARVRVCVCVCTRGDAKVMVRRQCFFLRPCPPRRKAFAHPVPPRLPAGLPIQFDCVQFLRNSVRTFINLFQAFGPAGSLIVGFADCTSCAAMPACLHSCAPAWARRLMRVYACLCVRACVCADFTWAHFKWAITIVMSRQNRVPNPVDGDHDLALVPLYDMVNHVPVRYRAVRWMLRARV